MSRADLIDNARGLAGLGLDKGYDELLYALSDELERLEEQLEAAHDTLREIAALPCYLDVVDQDEPDPRMTSLGDGDCPSCFATLALPASSPASRSE